MIIKEQIGDFEFVAQTTYYVYVSGNDNPVLTTSDESIFAKQKSMAIEGKITARKRDTETFEL